METNGRRSRRSGGQRILTIFLGVTVVFGLLSAVPREGASAPDRPPEEESVRTEFQTERPGDGLTPEEKLAIIESSPEYPPKLVKMAQTNGEALDFVYEYPARKGERSRVSLREDLEQEGVPLLMQWDERWGYQEYGDGPMGYTGCGPTCLSMAAVYLTGRDKWNPSRVADMAVKEGYMLKHHGSSWQLISEGCEKVGLKAEVLPLVKGTMMDRLDRGELIILALGPGDFTGSGHFVLVTGYEEEGFRIHDPNRRETSGKIWGFSRLKGQIRNLWAMSPR